MKEEVRVGLIRRTLGFIFIVVGGLGILLPILPGWIFLFVALYILGWEEIKRMTLSIKEQIENNNLNNKSSYFLRLYLIPLEWTLKLEQKKFKETIEEMK